MGDWDLGGGDEDEDKQMDTDVRSIQEVELTVSGDRLNGENEEEVSIKVDLQESSLSNCVDCRAISNQETLGEEQICEER